MRRPAQSREDLAQAEELEVVDQERREEQDRPAQPGQAHAACTPAGAWIDQITGSGIGRHCQSISASASVAAST